MCSVLEHAPSLSLKHYRDKHSSLLYHFDIDKRKETFITLILLKLRSYHLVHARVG
jgi:hypothetical protein